MFVTYSIIHESCHLLAMAAGHVATPELLDPNIDSGHRSYLSAVHRATLTVLRTRPPRQLLWLDQRWFGR